MGVDRDDVFAVLRDQIIHLLQLGLNIARPVFDDEFKFNTIFFGDFLGFKFSKYRKRAEPFMADSETKPDNLDRRALGGGYTKMISAFLGMIEGTSLHKPV